MLIVSATRRRRDIKIPLCMPAPVRKSLIVSKDHGRTYKSHIPVSERKYLFGKIWSKISKLSL